MESDRPFFSIIIPTYNHAHFIGRCIDSLIAQTYPNWEAIIVNNFSIDNTIEIIESYNDSRIRLINNANDGVIAISRNKGIEYANGDWICFLDSDDWWRPDKLKACLPLLDSYDFLYHDLRILYKKNGFWKRNKVTKGREINLQNSVADLFINGNPICNSSVMVRKTIINVVGPLVEDKNMVTVEDFDYWVRIVMVTQRIKYIPSTLGYYWIENNISKKLYGIEREETIFNKYGKKLNNEEKKSARILLEFKKARIYHYNNKYKNAIQSYLFVIKSNPEFKMYFKSLIGICSAYLKLKC